MNKSLLWCASLALLMTPAALARGDSFEQLAATLPRGSNALVMIDVERTLSSPLAEKEGWGKELELAYVERPVYLPPEAAKLVIGAHVRAGDDFGRIWEAAVMELSDPLSMRSIARSEGGYVDEINGTQVAWTPSNAYFVGLADRMLGVLFPADRQLVSRWIGHAKNNRQVELSDYLTKAARTTGKQVQVLFAIDLTDVLQPHELDENIKESKLFRDAKLSSETVVPLLTSLRGASLRILVDDDAQAQLRVDFAKDVTALKPVASDLIQAVLAEAVGNIEDFKSWKTKIQGKSISMQGKMSRDGQRRVFSVIELPSAKFSLVQDEKEPTEDNDESQMRESSLVYFRSISELLKDLKRDLRGNKASAAVMERYAGRIDRMPILHVDPELLDYGTNVAETLRGIALAKRQGGIQYGVNTAGMGGGGYTNYNYSGYGWGARGDRYQAARASAADRSSMRAEAMAGANQARVEGSKSLADATFEIRRAMTQKYGVEF